jgi:hypothetical protein
MSVSKHVGWWPSHWGLWSLLFFPFWWVYQILLFPALYLSRCLVWITPGRRWRSPIQDHILLGGMILPWDVSALKREGVGFVISLCAEFHDPVERLKRAGIGHLDLPTLDRGTPTKEQVEKGVAAIRDNVSRQVTTYIHCASGAGRSATLLGCYLVGTGMTAEEAVRHLKERRSVVSLNRAQRRVVEACAA